MSSILLMHCHGLSVHVLVLHRLPMHAIRGEMSSLQLSHVMGWLHVQIGLEQAIRLGVLVRDSIASLRDLLSESWLAVSLWVLELARVAIENCWVLRARVDISLRSRIVWVLVHF